METLTPLPPPVKLALWPRRTKPRKSAGSRTFSFGGRYDHRHLSMAQGGRLKIDKSKGLTVDGAKVVAPDVAASNGVIHVVDTVRMPK